MSRCLYLSAPMSCPPQDREEERREREGRNIEISSDCYWLESLESIKNIPHTHMRIIDKDQPSGRELLVDGVGGVFLKTAQSAAILHNIWTPSSRLRVSQLKSRRSVKQLCVSKEPEGFHGARCQPRPQIYHSCTKSLNLANFNSFCWDQQSLLLFFHESPTSFFFQLRCTFSFDCRPMVSLS